MRAGSIDTPKTVGGGTRVPRNPPTSAPLLNTSSYAMIDNPNVRTARLTPRVRSAGERHDHADRNRGGHRNEHDEQEWQPVPRPRAGR